MSRQCENLWVRRVAYWMTWFRCSGWADMWGWQDMVMVSHSWFNGLIMIYFMKNAGETCGILPYLTPLEFFLSSFTQRFHGGRDWGNGAQLWSEPSTSCQRSVAPSCCRVKLAWRVRASASSAPRFGACFWDGWLFYIYIYIYINYIFNYIYIDLWGVCIL